MSEVVSERPSGPVAPPPTGEGLTFEKVWAMFQETDRKMQENARQMEITDRKLDKLCEQMGGLHNSFGELAEHLVAPGIVERFNEVGFKFDEISTHGKRLYDEKGKVKTEIDLLLENGEFIVAVEIKSKPAIKHIEHHINRLKILREHRNKHHDKRKVLGAIAGAVFPPEVKKEVLDAGLFVIEQSGDTIRLDLPEGFVPMEW